MRLRTYFVLLCATVVLIPTVAFAGTTGTVNGYVRDIDSKAGVPGITVVLARPLEVLTTRTNAAGFYSFASVNVGRWSLSFADNGKRQVHDTCATRKFTVWADQVTSVNAKLPKSHASTGYCWWSLLPTSSTPAFSAYEVMH